MSDADDLRELERAMWAAAMSGDTDWIAEHVTDDFFEVGRSGDHYDRDDVVDDDSPPFDGELSDIDVAVLADGVALLTYRSAFHTAGTDAVFSHRTSVWVRVGDQWRSRFHQATPCPDWR